MKPYIIGIAGGSGSVAARNRACVDIKKTVFCRESHE